MKVKIPNSSLETSKKGNQTIKSFGKKEIKLFSRKKISEKHKAKLYADLHLLFSSGLDMNAVFEILIEQTQQESIREKMISVHQKIITGNNLADALKEEKLAGNYEYYALRIGEESGKLEEVLAEIKFYYERRQKQRRQVSGALTYPILVLVTAVLAVGFMLNVVVPMFEEVFQRFQGELPKLTQRIIELSEWMKSNGWLLIVGLLLMILLFRLLITKQWFKRYLHKSMLRVPIFGPLLKSIETARFCHIMTLLTSAHSPLVQSLQMIKQMISFIPLKEAISATEQKVIEGASLYDSLKTTGFFNRKFTSLVKAAEEVNKLDYAFEKLNNQYNEEIDHRLKIIERLMEPLLIVLVGGMVAVILVAMYLPLFEIGGVY